MRQAMSPGVAGVPIITTLAEYQTRFWLKVGQRLVQRGRDVTFLSFDSRSNQMLAAAGLDVVDATPAALETLLAGVDPREVCARYGVEPLNYWLTHEKFAFGLSDSRAMVRKLAGSLLAANEAIDRSGRRGRTMMVQEVGGFLSVVGSHHAALHRGIESWMIEPSFFRKRLLFREGSMDARRFPRDLSATPGPEVEAYLANTLQQSAIVIPEKDRHQYTTAFRKVVNLRNGRRLIEKVIDKHVLGKQQEFGHIGSHVSQHVKMIANSRRLRSAYTPLEDCGRFVYYPLHVPGDMALTLRSPEYLDQLALIDYLCRIAPFGVRVAIKEHPAMIGAVSASRIHELLARYDNLAVLPPSTNNYAVLRAAAAVVTVNSKTGAEAGLTGVPVIVLGDAFYRYAPFARAIDNVRDLGAALAEVVAQGRDSHADETTMRWFAGLWPQTSPGELYVCDEDNIATFTNSLEAALA